MKRVIPVLGAIIISLFAGYFGSWYINNRNIPYPDIAEVKGSFLKGSTWLARHREELLNIKNPMLWWMVMYANDVYQNPDIESVYREYEKSRVEPRPYSAWLGLFKKGSWVPVKYSSIKHLPYYNIHAIAALYCDEDLLGIPSIARQNDPSFCNSSGYWYRPACATHQLMGLRFLQDRDCDLVDNLDGKISAVQRKIRKQAIWDTRVVDVYIQRVLMLVESSAYELVKPVWIRRIINAQRKDGGWSESQELFKISDDVSVNIGSRGFTVKKLKSDFHATAQGILLMALLLDMQNEQQPK